MCFVQDWVGGTMVVVGDGDDCDKEVDLNEITGGNPAITFTARHPIEATRKVTLFLTLNFNFNFNRNLNFNLNFNP